METVRTGEPGSSPAGGERKGDLSVDGRPSPSVSKRLALRSGNECAFPGCQNRLEREAPALGEGTILGIECHIVARRDHPTVARAPCLLTDAEKEKWAQLIEARHGFNNLVLMCREHAYLIDDVAQEISVQEIVEMKHAHEAAVLARRREDAAAAVAGEPGGTKPAPPPRPLILEDVGEWQRRSIRALAEADPVALEWLRSELGDEDSAARVQALVRRWPQELAAGSAQLLEALAREAEARGLWSEAAEVWSRLADKATDPITRADRLVRAAIDAGAAAESERRAELLAVAEELDPESVRLQLERIDDLGLDPPEQLEYLATLASDDDSLAALIAAQRSLASLMLPDLAAAKRAADEAARLEPEAIQVQAAQINLKIQEARLAVIGDRQFVMAEAMAARDSALDLRQRLLEMKLWEESARLLMMAAEVMGLLRDPAAALQILERAAAEEFEVAPLGAEVLGDAALRMEGAELALRFTSTAIPTDAIERIRATAEADLPGPGRGPALERLEKLALGGGPEAEFAAASRLLACLPPTAAEWSDEVAAVLEGGRNETMAPKLKAMAIARSDPDRAREIALEQPAEPWAAELRLRVGRLIDDDEMTRDAAEEFFSHGPDATGMLLIGKAFASIEERQRARSALIPLARDPNSAPRVRSQSYDALMSILAEEDGWEEARRIWDEWSDFATRECPSALGRVSAWQVRVLNRSGGG